MTATGKICWRVFAVFSCAGLFFLLGQGIGLFCVRPVRQISFDAAKWRAACAGNNKRPLYAMSSDLVARLRAEHPTHEQVVNLLGDPYPYMHKTDTSSGNFDIEYDLGRRSDSFLSVPMRWWLWIEFESNRVSWAGVGKSD